MPVGGKLSEKSQLVTSGHKRFGLYGFGKGEPDVTRTRRHDSQNKPGNYLITLNQAKLEKGACIAIPLVILINFICNV